MKKIQCVAPMPTQKQETWVFLKASFISLRDTRDGRLFPRNGRVRVEWPVLTHPVRLPCIGCLQKGQGAEMGQGRKTTGR